MSNKTVEKLIFEFKILAMKKQISRGERMKFRQDGQCISYVLEENERFSMTAFRVLKKQKEKGLLECYKAAYNGQIQLVFSIVDMIPLAIVTDTWMAKDVHNCVLKLLKIIRNIQDNGFIPIETVDIHPEHIFYHQMEDKIYVVAVPVQAGGFGTDKLSWETAFRRMLVSLAALSREAYSVEMSRLKLILEDYSLTLRQVEELLENDTIKITSGIKLSDNVKKNTDYKQENNIKKNVDNQIDDTSLKLVLQDEMIHREFEINRTEYVIGKSVSMADGVFNITPTVSRMHCKIYHKSDGYWVEDLHSKNYTYLNECRLKPGIQIQLHDGDFLRLAEHKFKVQII